MRRIIPLPLFIIMVLLLLAGCQAQAGPQATETVPGAAEPEPVILPELPGDAAGNPETPAAPGAEHPSEAVLAPAAPTPAEPAVHPAAPQEIQRPQYLLWAELDYATHRLTVREVITYTNPLNQAINTLPLMVDPATYPGGFELAGITYNGGQALGAPSLESNQLQITLALPLNPGETIRLELAYTLALPSPAPSAETRPVPFGYSPLQTNLVDWYPFIPPYRAGQGWLAHRPGFYGEHLAYDQADFEIYFRTLDARTDLLVAASAPAEALTVDGETWQRYRLQAARNFAISVSHTYTLQTRQVGEVTVLSYFFPVHAAAGERVLRTTAESLELFNRLYGPYPHKTLTVVEADFLDGMEYDGLYFLSKGFYNLYTGTDGEYLTAIASHETAHQWWYALVANDQALEPWLDEALCTYSERLYFENYYPAALEWWWAYRVKYYEPRGWVNDSIYNPHGSLQPYRDYRDAVYLNGAMFLEELRAAIGDEAFFAFLLDYQSTYRGQIATAQDFFTRLRQHTSADITPLIDKYFAK